MTPRKARKRKHMRLESELESLERRLLHTLHERLDRTRSVSAHNPTEFMDIVADSEMDDLAARIAEFDAGTIEEIEDALTLLREGKYGVCQVCGRKISKRRLEVRPFATECIECKRRTEQKTARRPGFPPAAHEATADVGAGEVEEHEPAMDELFRDAETSDIF